MSNTQNITLATLHYDGDLTDEHSFACHTLEEAIEHTQKWVSEHSKSREATKKRMEASGMHRNICITPTVIDAPREWMYQIEMAMEAATWND